MPVLAYVKEAFDATIALALAAQVAGRLDGAGIRDRPHTVGSLPGSVVNAGPNGVADALRILTGAGEIDYEGASGSMDWDADGDLHRGHIGIWHFTENERIEEVQAAAFEKLGHRFRHHQGTEPFRRLWSPLIEVWRPNSA